ncbi:hypothetical protein [Undibacterium sp.]|uniref:hypothetical protein n=1 Tax=Undibacterium sp. TaxID=1914977 RepID=UPI002D7F397F|nr:hypothetical protein [Undibacterium sp.]
MTDDKIVKCCFYIIIQYLHSIKWFNVTFCMEQERWRMRVSAGICIEERYRRAAELELFLLMIWRAASACRNIQA